MTIAAADYAGFLVSYPEFTTTVAAPQYAALFNEAGLYLSNEDCSIVAANATTFQPRLMLLQMVVAHLAKMRFGVAGEPPTGLVGRVSNATEGSVSVATEYNMGLQGSAFWSQTQYGAQYWQATARYRGFRYVPGRQPVFAGRGGFPWQR